MPELAANFYSPWEEEISSAAEIDDLLRELTEKWLFDDRLFAWRGVANADYPFHSSLYRRLIHRRQKEGISELPDEEALAQAEMNVLIEAHRWGLHSGSSGRLSVLNQLAALQHFGAPTRLLDVSLNAYVGLFFAVEKDDELDGRLFAIDVSRRTINERAGLRDWEDRVDVPWPGDGREPSEGWKPSDWTSKALAWKPPTVERRIAAQNGAFLFGGAPATKPGFQPPEAPGGRRLKTAEVRAATSLALRFHKADPEAGGVGIDGSPAYTFRIAAGAKGDIRKRLRAAFGYSHRTIYPDFPGFAAFALSNDDVLIRPRQGK